MPVLAKRPEGERGSTGKRLTIKAFNDGKLDVAILNRSGSTGVMRLRLASSAMRLFCYSMHAGGLIYGSM